MRRICVLENAQKTDMTDGFWGRFVIFQDVCAELHFCFGLWCTERRRNASQTQKYSTLAGDVTPTSVLAEIFEKALCSMKQNTRHLKQIQRKWDLYYESDVFPKLKNNDWFRVVNGRSVQSWFSDILMPMSLNRTWGAASKTNFIKTKTKLKKD